jgi:N-methylhydantoinase A
VVAPDHIVEIAERVDRNGEVALPLDEVEVRSAIQSLMKSGVRAIAVCFLWAPVNPAHERRVGELIRDLDPSIQVSLSHEIAPILGEYERAATAAVNSYVAPVVAEYLRGVEHHLRERGLKQPLMIIQADGGSTLASAVLPVRTIESGPAAGMVAVKEIGDAIKEPNIIATDVGGTTFKVGLFVNGKWNVARETVVSQYTLALPMVDLVSIGSGGGSIAWLDHDRLRVGPRSAAADPGPACYGLGGTEPTVTDADVALGFIGTDRPLGGRIHLNRERALEAIERRIASKFGGDVMAAAAAIRQIVDAQMAGLVRKATLERGYDPRRFILMAYGGSGPVHAADYASGLGISRVVIPTAATVYSALGAAMSDVRYSLERPMNVMLSASTDLGSALENMKRQVTDTVARLDNNSQIQVEYWADVRYDRQLHSIRIAIDPTRLTEADLHASFIAKYRELYGENALLPGAQVRLLRVGVDGIGVIAKTSVPRVDGSGESHPVGRRQVYWPRAGAWRDTTLWDVESLAPHAQVDGPALISFPGTTAAVPQGACATLDDLGLLTIRLEQMS